MAALRDARERTEHVVGAVRTKRAMKLWQQRSETMQRMYLLHSQAGRMTEAVNHYEAADESAAAAAC